MLSIAFSRHFRRKSGDYELTTLYVRMIDFRHHVIVITEMFMHRLEHFCEQFLVRQTESKWRENVKMRFVCVPPLTILKS